ncbi:carbonic anhydrase [Saccharothrix sp. ALI-22-I]|uniref:carbonic anhydrase n=1 Tax=Saccharothrix sp. ALI-22-I TaxID=1933778 RepID=UPI001EE6C45C|nr:carbonic anhydrase [Saccharothrix sp. ALI-22-I]
MTDDTNEANMAFQHLVAHARAHRDRISEAQRRALAEGQQPLALFITCSDSRIVPARITGAEPGQLFELRTAGYIVPPYTSIRPVAETATIEYAVEVLGVPDIVVCGHSHCGAVGALCSRDGLDELPALRNWLAEATPVPAPREGDPARKAEAQQHVLNQLRTLADYPFVRKRLERGELRLHGWLYEIDTGEVLFCPDVDPTGSDLSFQRL